jgi:histidine triad (HIT) family protein
MYKNRLLFCFLILTSASVWSQSEVYQKNKAEKIAAGSVFTKIINREAPANIVYEDEDIIAFVPIRKQAPVHLLIVPRKKIHTVNDATDEDLLILGKMILVAKKLAKENGISETGFRLAMNTNEDAGQSVFHLHMHLLGGRKLGPMTDENLN